MVDTGTYAMLGNDDLFLRMLQEGAPAERLADYVAWTVTATQSLAVKIVNPGGINAFKFNGRDLGFDEPSPHYGLTPRTILTALATAVRATGIAHPLHVHCNDLGVAGNVETTLATIASVEETPLHLTHVQFHAYGDEGPRSFSSGAARIAESVNARGNISVDVGQVMFGQTVTASGDTMAQYRGRGHASPRKWIAMDIECEAGCGVLPVRYRDTSHVNALQWAIGLELFLMVEDPWRIFLTTDHPNGAPFETYPHLIRLLMDRSFREEVLSQVNPEAADATQLAGIDREYSLSEIAIITRAGPARSLGLADRGHLGPGAVADVTVYEDRPNRQEMFARPRLVLKDGRVIVRDGALTEVVWGCVHTARPAHDPAIRDAVGEHLRDCGGVAVESYVLRDEEVEQEGRGLVRYEAARR